jgi:hypothetical protein
LRLAVTGDRFPLHVDAHLITFLLLRGAAHVADSNHYNVTNQHQKTMSMINWSKHSANMKSIANMKSSEFFIGDLPSPSRGYESSR